jgi:hypothetical protein
MLILIAVVVTAVAVTALYEWFRRLENKKRSVPGAHAPQMEGFVGQPSTGSELLNIPNPPNLTSAPLGNRRMDDPNSPSVFYSDGYPLPVRKAWGDIPYEELGPMFLDQFLLRYFAPWMCRSGLSAADTLSPWDTFAYANPWAKEMPLLFEQLTGYKLNDMQLNNAIAEYVRRSQKSARKPIQGEVVITDPPAGDFYVQTSRSSGHPASLSAYPNSAATPVQRETENAEYTPDFRDRLTPGGL